MHDVRPLDDVESADLCVVPEVSSANQSHAVLMLFKGTPEGFTDDALCVASGLPLNTIHWRRMELERDGFIIKVWTIKRKTRAGGWAYVYCHRDHYETLCPSRPLKLNDVAYL